MQLDLLALLEPYLSISMSNASEFQNTVADTNHFFKKCNFVFFLFWDGLGCLKYVEAYFGRAFSQVVNLLANS